MNIDHNKPNREVKGMVIYKANNEPTSEEYCQSTQQNEITILTNNNVTQLPIDGVDLKFTCGRYTCAMGTTEWETSSSGAMGAVALLTKKFPYCLNGILRGNKETFEILPQKESTPST